jgi:hypothetical protein
MQKTAGSLCRQDTSWAGLSWVWHSTLADIHWHDLDYPRAAIHLQRMITAAKIPPLDVARGKLQLCMCNILAGKIDAGDTERSVRALMEDVLSASSGAHLRWFAGDKLVMDANIDAPEHHVCAWSEIGVHCVVMLMKVGQLSPGKTLVLSQVCMCGCGVYDIDDMHCVVMLVKVRLRVCMCECMHIICVCVYMYIYIYIHIYIHTYQHAHTHTRQVSWPKLWNYCTRCMKSDECMSI